MVNNFEYGLFGLLIVIPIIVIFVLKAFIYKRKNLLILLLLIGFIFIKGSLISVGVLSTNHATLIIDFFVLAIVFAQIIFKTSLKISYWKNYLLVFLISFFSWILSDVNLYNFVMFLRHFTFFYLTFVLIENINIKRHEFPILIKYVSILSLSQIIISVAKFQMIGVSERFIGSLDVFGGSTTTIFALMGISYCFVYFLYSKKMFYLLIIIGFFFFSMVGGKRAMPLYLTLIVLISYLLYFLYHKYYLKGTFKPLKFLPLLLLISICSIYISVRMLPTLNKENIVGGSFDLNYALEYSNSYINESETSDYAKYYGRGDAPLAVINLLNKKNSLLFGLGAGDLVRSKYNNEQGLRFADFVGKKYNIGYGARTGVLTLLLQIGFIGIFFYLLFFIRMFLTVKNNIKVSKSDDHKVLGIIILVWLIIIFIDFFTYSISSFTNRSIVLLFSVFYFYFTSRFQGSNMGNLN
jgi:hypothetical protein